MTYFNSHNNKKRIGTDTMIVIMTLLLFPYWMMSDLTKINKECVLECVKFILQNNNMKFNNEFYNQIKGTAKGIIFAPTYTTL